MKKFSIITNFVSLLILLAVLSACSGSNSQILVDKDNILQAQLQENQTEILEDLQAELEVLRAEIDSLRQQEYEVLETNTTMEITLAQDISEEAEFARAELDALRQELAPQFAPINPPPVGSPPIGRWFLSHRDGSNWTGLYTMHEFHNEGMVRTYRGYWGTDERELLYERIWDTYSISEGHGRFISQASIIRISDTNGTALRFRLFTPISSGRGILSLSPVNEEYNFLHQPHFYFNLPTPGWHYAQLANVSLSEISGNWYYSDTIWPPPIDSDRFFVQYFLDFDGVLHALYHVRERADQTTTNPEWSRIGRWSFSNNTVNMHFDSGIIVSYILRNGELHSTNAVLQRELNISVEHQRAIAQEDARQEATIRNLQRRVLGQWHWDLTLWIFNEDGTGFLDVPHIGVNPQSYHHFTYEVMEPPEGYDAFLIIHFSEDWSASLAGTSGMYWVRFGPRAGGSMELGGGGREPLLLTRMFDFNNTPFVDDLFDGLMHFMDLIGIFIP